MICLTGIFLEELMTSAGESPYNLRMVRLGSFVTKCHHPEALHSTYTHMPPNRPPGQCRQGLGTGFARQPAGSCANSAPRGLSPLAEAPAESEEGAKFTLELRPTSGELNVFLGSAVRPSVSPSVSLMATAHSGRPTRPAGPPHLCYSREGTHVNSYLIYEIVTQVILSSSLFKRFSRIRYQNKRSQS